MGLQPRAQDRKEWAGLRKRGVVRAISIYENRIRDLAVGVNLVPERCQELDLVRDANLVFLSKAKIELDLLSTASVLKRLRLTCKALSRYRDRRFVKRWVQLLVPAVGLRLAIRRSR